MTALTKRGEVKHILMELAEIIRVAPNDLDLTEICYMCADRILKTFSETEGGENVNTKGNV
jgi:hypothetical protein